MEITIAGMAQTSEKQVVGRIETASLSGKPNP
jgi:hypothetical protein